MINQIQSATVNPVTYSQNQIYANNQEQTLAPAYKQDVYAGTTKKGIADTVHNGAHTVWNGIKTGLNKLKTGVVHTVQHTKEFLATPTGKKVALAATIGLGAAMIFTPLLPLTFTAVGGAVTAVGTGLVSAGTAISSAAAGVAATTTAVASSPFVAGFLGGMTGAIVAPWIKEKIFGKPNNCHPQQPQPCPSEPCHPQQPTQPAEPCHPQPTQPQQPQPCPSEPCQPQQPVQPQQPATGNPYNFANAKYDISVITGISKAEVNILKASGINTVGDLLEKANTRKERLELEAKTGIKARTIVDWVNKADLMRIDPINGIGVKYSHLLEAAGVDTIVELSYRNPVNLYNKLVAINNTNKYADRLPSAATLADWIARAKQMPRIITY